jgi:predicted esterase
MHPAKILLLCFLFFSSVLSAAPRLNSYNLDSSQVYVAGISSGGYMAVQAHVAFSSRFRGAAVVAGGPFYCANANMQIALTACMKFPALISITELVTITANTANMGFIDPTYHLANQRVWLLVGTKDTVVHPGVTKKLQTYYEHYLSPGSIKTVYDIPAEHAWIRDDYGSACDYLGTPFINNCHFDMNESFLKHIYQNKTWEPKTAANSSNLLEFDQTEFITGGHSTLYGLDTTGYVYLPTSCRQGRKCSLLVLFHGCQVAKDNVGNAFVSNIGVNEWAEANDIVVVYPQAAKNIANPQSCWDWWGYSGPQYASNVGFQMIMVKNIMNRLLNQ